MLRLIAVVLLAGCAPRLATMTKAAAPEVVADLDQVDALVADERGVWIAGVRGNKPVLLLGAERAATPAAPITALLTDGGMLFWADERGALVAFDGKTAKTLATLEEPATGLAADTKLLYATQPDEGIVVAVPRGGGELRTITGGFEEAPRWLARVGTKVYVGLAGSSLLEAPWTGGDPEISYWRARISALASTAGDLYWSDFEKAIFRLPYGERFHAITVTTDDPTAIAVDSSSVVWSERDGKRVCLIDRAGRELFRVLATTTGPAGPVAVHGRTVYFVDEGPPARVLMLVARPE
jgi:hypothetical protein